MASFSFLEDTILARWSKPGKVKVNVVRCVNRKIKFSMLVEGRKINQNEEEQNKERRQTRKRK
jgi:hypothetical protein